MDSRDHINNQVIEIIEELAAKRKNSSLQTASNNVEIQDQKVIPIRSGQDIQHTQNSTKSTAIEKENPNSLKSLLAARHNLEGLRNRLSKDPEKNKAELDKLNKLEGKLNTSINKAQKKEITLAIDTLKREPKRYVLKLAETKTKIEELKSKLEKNPRLYKVQIEKLENFEKMINNRIESSQVKTLRSAINNVQKNPQKYRAMIDRYDQMECTLNKGLNQEKQINLQKENQKNKEKEPAKKQEKTRNDLELSR
ncbi:hypothetical protein P4H71_28150 [Paenibacillus kribbensis]|uniref:hypothetical protein n=1 Tax=Paenibacillus kribbensis TaxID=172713 RepID=UPI002DBF3555|nr:hypothetical protein [Paenibacillus kribbensis]MEC0238190.1 hypothetical protein [Paenibacillus kribbensis]